MHAGFKMTRDSQGRLDFGGMVDRSFWGILIAIGAYIANQSGSINQNISELNQKIGVIFEKISNQEKRLDMQREKMIEIERRLIDYISDKQKKPKE